ncbi:uncharacterized protein K452DRAFT_271090 [Aplosporella prunicola CBS 121167]|uniref:Uncharacterized protein n=1 Tax=Aplosporella prunicola CBS 121167 TaxID=1176127 RepID=A0A6A6BI58_9PEZI|nr:uncharacterized protein K452DRAFT_271090 [Aplosporella prunicola CBS 121167]KAF2142241.1 hypothetical protein K452DRAFT_271090 [Aplosporella prunicola CBS 121167]
MAQQLTLFDLPSKGRNAAWSYNPWKTRLALNYKNVDYKTEWLEYPDVAPTLKATGLAPNPGDDDTPYTIPAVRLPSGEVIMDSAKIAPKLEELYPEPSLHLDSGYSEKLAQIFPEAVGALRFVLIPRVPGSLLNERSAEYFYRTRKENFGVPLDVLEKERGGEQAWEKAKAPLEKVAAMLKENDGPFFLGEQVCYADFVVVSVLQFCKRIGQDLYDRIVAIDKAYDDIYKASAKWLERDDH